MKKAIKSGEIIIPTYSLIDRGKKVRLLNPDLSNNFITMSENAALQADQIKIARGILLMNISQVRSHVNNQVDGIPASQIPARAIRTALLDNRATVGFILSLAKDISTFINSHSTIARPEHKPYYVRKMYKNIKIK
jgi:hypothetical protein